MAWTPEQQYAIDVEGNNVIVSAGAGSGKTAVLTQRVIRKLLSGVHINELLILTFTNAAAAEMKDRIRKAILKHAELKDEIDLLDGAYITTFDSYALSVIKKYHTRLNISNKIAITDEVVVDLLKKELLDQIFEEKYLTPKKEFMNLINHFCLKDDKELKKYILNILKKIELKYDKSSYLDNYFDIDNIDIFINEYLEVIFNKVNEIKELFRDLPSYFNNDFCLKMEDAYKGIINSTNYEELVNSLEFTNPRAGKYSCNEARYIKNSIDSLLKEIKELCIYENTNEMKEEFLSTVSDTKEIVSILRELDKRIDDYKSNNEIYNFGDVSRLAIKVVLENEDIREEIKNSFNEILVDEYQDTNDTQEKFISLISKNNVYMVGDIKQSIYRFRNANPYIFKDKYDRYSNSDDGIKIDLLKNFRSRSEVLDSINLLFDLFMDDSIGGANYRESHRMVFGNTNYIENGSTDQDYKLDCIVYDDKKLGKLSKSEEEAFIIANDIKNKIYNKYQVFDKETNSLRDAEYRDFVVLLDRGRDFDLYKKIFEYNGLPLTIMKDESLTKDDDILIIRNILRLLRCIKEERYDVEFKYTYTSLCRSYLNKISDLELYDIFANEKFKNTEIFKRCVKIVEKQDVMNLSSYLLYILDEFNYEEKLLTTSNIKAFRVRVEYLYNLCCSYEEVGKNVYDFIDYLNQIFENDYDLKFNINSSGNNSCVIMNIHKSKGLEFPVCYFAGYSNRFNMDEAKERITYDNKYGIIVPKVDNYYKDTILKTLLKNNIRHEEVSEKIRLFYVALTRVREKMILVIPKQEEEMEVRDIVPSMIREKYISFLSIIKSIYSSILPFTREVEIIGSRDYQNIIDDFNLDELDHKNLDVEEINIETNEVEEKHYSKDKLHLVEAEEKEVMEFGTLVHSILEEIDFNDYDLSLYDVNGRVKSKIEAFIKSDFMKDKLNLNTYKEYEFLYEEDNKLSHGIIDLLLEDKDKMIIVDYKLKNIMDSEYDKQLNGYRKFIEEKTGKKTYCYLYSILNEEVREV